MDCSSTVVSSRATWRWPARISSKQYDLYMRVDTNTNGHMQWYYFSVNNSKKMKIRFNIYRFRKRYSLYQRGMRPYVRSRKSGGDWHPAGENVKYYREKFINQNGVKAYSNFFYLTFIYTFEHENDQVYFAAGIPYTTTFLNSQLQSIEKVFLNIPAIKFECTTLCTSLCGQDIEVVTIQPRQDSYSPRKKNFIIINARSHSGQTSGSWVLDGFMEALSVDREMQEWMIKLNICFRIVPMLNKDGVFIGNYRTGVVGDDFNRKFATGQRQFFPEIFALKKLVAKCKKMGKVKLFLDLHGHSILKNSFFFGPDRKGFQSEQLINLDQHLLHHSKYFSRISSIYRNEKGKGETARVYFQLQQQILALTCENSLGLYYHQCQTFQQTSGDWQIFGRHLLQGIMSILSTNVEEKEDEIIKKYSDNIEEQNRAKIKRNLHWIKSDRKNKMNEQSQVGNNTSSILTISKKKKDLLDVIKKTEVVQKSTKQGTEKRQISKVSGNATSPCRDSRSKFQKDKSIDDSMQDGLLQKSIILTRYTESPTKNIKESLRNSRTANAEHQSLSLSLNLINEEEEEILPDNFSEEYESINDSDSEAQDLEPCRKEELLKCIKEIRKSLISEEAIVQDSQNSHQLQPIKGFKEYRLNFEHQGAIVSDKKPALNKLKPLKFQQFKIRGFTEKKIKGNLDLLFNSNSSMISDRIETRILLNPNPHSGSETSNKRSKQMKREEIINEMFPRKADDSEYLLMRIKEMKLQNGRQTDK